MFIPTEIPEEEKAENNQVCPLADFVYYMDRASNKI